VASPVVSQGAEMGLEYRRTGLTRAEMDFAEVGKVFELAEMV
jgi:hypothetical protein